MKTARTMSGWIIIWPDGTVETDYFSVKKFDDKGVRISREKFMEIYRPHCKTVKALLKWVEN